MAELFGLEDDENLDLINKVSQVIGSSISISKKNVNHANDDKRIYIENNASFFKGGAGAITPGGNVSKTEVTFLKDLSQIELKRSGTDNIILTDRNEFLLNKDLITLKGELK